MKSITRDDKILVIIGPSGVGKSSLVQMLVKDGIITLNPTWTTRPPRRGELKGDNEHKFTDEVTFHQMCKAGELIEPIQLFGLPSWYAMPRLVAASDTIPTAMLRSMVAGKQLQYYPKTVFYQIEDDIDRVKERLAKRSQDGQDLGSRIELYGTEINDGRAVAKRVILNNKDIADAYRELVTFLSIDFHDILR